MIWCLSNARSGDLQFGTSFIALRALVREITPNTIGTHPPTHMPTYMTQVGFPSIVWLRLRAFVAQPPSESPAEFGIIFNVGGIGSVGNLILVLFIF